MPSTKPATSLARHTEKAQAAAVVLTAFVAQKDSGLPVVKVGETDPVGEFRMETSLGTLGS